MQFIAETEIDILTSILSLSQLMLPVVLKTKYAFHALLWALNPDAVLDIGSMDCADSKRFRGLLKDSDRGAFEVNPNNVWLMEAGRDIQNKQIRVINQLVSGSQGFQSFYILRAPNLNCSPSSALAHSESGMRSEEVQATSILIDSCLKCPLLPLQQREFQEMHKEGILHVAQ